MHPCCCRPRPQHAAGRVLFLLATIFTCSVHAAEEIGFNQPFQIAQPTPDHASLITVAESMEKLSRHKGNIAVLAVVGPYHSGKSFLLNAIIGNNKVFQVGPKTTPETMGIWLCRTHMTTKDHSEVWLMDSEGFFGPGVTENYDAKIFTISTLLGSHLLYNTVKIIDQQAVNLLEMLARQAQLFRTRGSAESNNLSVPEFLSVRNLPPLTWVVEDFVQELPSVSWNSKANDATAWLQEYLSKVNDTGYGQDDHFLSRIYSDLKVHTLFLPATSREHLKDLSKLEWSQLTTEFRGEVAALREEITKTRSKTFDGRAVNGQTLQEAIKFIVQALQRGMFSDLPSLWETWTVQVAEMSLQDAESWFRLLISRLDDNQKDPKPVAVLSVEIDQSREKAVSFYKELLRDFDVRPNIHGLKKGMHKQFQVTMEHYHDHVRRWIDDLITQEKDRMDEHLHSIKLPVDPGALKKTAAVGTQNSVAALNGRLGKFSARAPAPTYGSPVTMPTFTVEPAVKITKDLEALLGARELENDREILQELKSAVAAAEEAVDKSWRPHMEKPLGMAQFQELSDTSAAKCWQVFDERLSRHKWMKLTVEYKKHKAHVQQETIGARISRLRAMNEQRLQVHFRAALEQAVGSYKTRKQHIGMPCSEEELKSEHAALVRSVREVLEHSGGTLADTKSFEGAISSLGGVAEEGLQQLRQKNVELWKVHSDEATRCALIENHKVEKMCGLLCLFTKVPAVHKSVSRNHLFQCLAKSGTGSRMSQAMQADVFESWYDKDLANDAASVRNNFFIATLLIGMIGIFVFCGIMAPRTGQPQPGFQQQYPQQQVFPAYQPGMQGFR